MSYDEAKRTLRGMGKTIASNTPGPSQLAEGFRQTVLPVLPIWVLIGLMLLFGEPLVRWMTAAPPQHCRIVGDHEFNDGHCIPYCPPRPSECD